MSKEAGTRHKLRRTLARWADAADQEDEDLRREHDHGQQCIADAPDRDMVTLTGTLRTVTLRPRGGVPALEAELDDGTGSIVLVWLGRRRITAIGPGRSMRVTGRIGVQEGRRLMYNPRYELIP